MFLPNRTMQPGKLLLLIVAVTFLTGCQMPKTVSELNIKPFKTSTPEIEYGQPLRMAIIWKESAVNAAGKKPVRGFGGRVYFYDEENETIRVDGDLTVYAFDDTNDHAVKARQPDRKYVFRAGELQRHYGQTGLGDSYNIWIPWDEVGGERKTISLVPVFKPVNGMIPKSDQSIAILSGTTSDEEREFLRRDGMEQVVKPVSMTVPGGEARTASAVPVTVDPSQEDAAPQEATIRTTTFEVPRSIASRLKTSGVSNVRRTLATEKSGLPAKQPSRSLDASAAATQKQAPAAVEKTEADNRRRSVFSGKPKTDAQEAKLRKPTVFGQPGGFR